MASALRASDKRPSPRLTKLCQGRGDLAPPLSAAAAEGLACVRRPPATYTRAREPVWDCGAKLLETLPPTATSLSTWSSSDCPAKGTDSELLPQALRSQRHPSTTHSALPRVGSLELAENQHVSFVRSLCSAGCRHLTNPAIRQQTPPSEKCRNTTTFGDPEAKRHLHAELARGSVRQRGHGLAKTGSST